MSHLFVHESEMRKNIDVGVKEVSQEWMQAISKKIDAPKFMLGSIPTKKQKLDA